MFRVTKVSGPAGFHVDYMLVIDHNEGLYHVLMEVEYVREEQVARSVVYVDLNALAGMSGPDYERALLEVLSSSGNSENYLFAPHKGALEALPKVEVTEAQATRSLEGLFVEGLLGESEEESSGVVDPVSQVLGAQESAPRDVLHPARWGLLCQAVRDLVVLVRGSVEPVEWNLSGNPPAVIRYRGWEEIERRLDLSRPAVLLVFVKSEDYHYVAYVRLSSGEYARVVGTVGSAEGRLEDLLGEAPDPQAAKAVECAWDLLFYPLSPMMTEYGPLIPRLF